MMANHAIAMPFDLAPDKAHCDAVQIEKHLPTIGLLGNI